jgi:hypothetical protein
MKNLQNKRNYSKHSAVLAQRRRLTNTLQPLAENTETAMSIAETIQEDTAFALRRTYVHANTLKSDEIIRAFPEYNNFQTVIIRTTIVYSCALTYFLTQVLHDFERESMGDVTRDIFTSRLKSHISYLRLFLTAESKHANFSDLSDLDIILHVNKMASTKKGTRNDPLLFDIKNVIVVFQNIIIQWLNNILLLFNISRSVAPSLTSELIIPVLIAFFS